MGEMLDKLKAFLETEEGKESIKSFGEKLEKEDVFRERWRKKIVKYLESIDNLDASFESYIKHEEKQSDVLYNRGIDGQSSITFIIFDAITVVGNCSPLSDWGDFTTDMYEYKGYMFDMICGQGCFVRIWKK